MASTEKDHIPILGISPPSATGALPPQLARRRNWFITALAFAIAVLLTAVALPATQAQTYQVMHNFTGGQDGAYPQAGLTMDKAGNLYGTTAGIPFSATTVDDLSTNGTVFKIAKKGSGWVFSPLYSFSGGNDGSAPEARVALGPDGSLYGTTAAGGGSGPCYALPVGGCGTVFNLKPTAVACKAALCPWAETVLYRFSGENDGGSPFADLVFDQSGNAYGTTYVGGAYESGAVFELTRSGSAWMESVLYSFSGGEDGGFPKGGVIFDVDGNLYGTTASSGANNWGTVFELTSMSLGWMESTLYDFQGGSDGGAPLASLIVDDSGNLYGATSSRGAGQGGTSFELTASGGWLFNTLYGFAGNLNCGPNAALAMDQAGNLYGTTYCDGAYGYGSVFKLTHSNGSWTYTSLHDFTGGNDGANPHSNVVFDAIGKLYGTASIGGAYGYGVVFEITP